MPLQYHQAALDLLQRQPEISQSNIQHLDALEQKQGISLPAAVREWYQLTFATEVLRYQDYPITVENLGKSLIDADASSPIQDGYLFIMRENQDVYEWVVKLDGSDDPPVIAAEEAMHYTHYEPEWRDISPRFSDFIYTYLWDKQVITAQYRLSITIYGWNLPLEETDWMLPIATLRQKMPEITQIQHNYQTQVHRFMDGDKRLRVNTPQEGKNAGKMTGCYLSADTPENLTVLVKHLWDNVPRHLHAYTPENKEILAQLRGES